MKSLLLDLLILTTSMELIAENVALRRNCTYCETTLECGWIVDGVTFKTRAQLLAPRCPVNAFVDIDLADYYYVHYVVLYEGTFAGDRMDYFVVREFARTGLVLCSTYPRKTRNELGRGLRVNCKIQPPANIVRVESRINNGLEIAEIEVHSLFDRHLGVLYIGCFGHFHGEGSILTDIEGCRSHCGIRWTFMAIANFNQCGCGNQIDWRYLIHAGECVHNCSSHSYKCGGNFKFSLYLLSLAFPHYLGCHRYDLKSPVEKLGVNLSSCISFCEPHLFAMMSNGSTCSCTNDEVGSEESDQPDQCNIACPNDKIKTCGGLIHASTYGTCRTSGCSEFIHCLDDMDEYGRCVDDLCKQHYYGDHCMLKEYHACNSDPCVEPDTKCIDLVDTFRCDCQEGFNRLIEEGSCIDIDECVVENRCTTQGSFCTNTDGSYFCVPVCPHGFLTVLERGTCLDNDECKLEPCDPTISKCINNDGSYKCECLPFYIEVEKDICIINNSVGYSLLSRVLHSLAILLFILLITCIIAIASYSKEDSGFSSEEAAKKNIKPKN